MAGPTQSRLRQPSVTTKGQHQFSSAASILLNLKGSVITWTSKQYVKTHHTRLRKKFAFPVLRNRPKIRGAVLTTMESQETEVVVWGNGMWILHIHYFGCAESKVLYSNTMEIRGFKEALLNNRSKWSDGLYISTDGHPQIIKEWVTQRCWKRSGYR